MPFLSRVALRLRLPAFTHCPTFITAISLAIGMAFGGNGAHAQTASADLMSKGKYLATAADCAACHTAPEGGQPYAGGYGIVSPLGTIFSSNITPSKVDGIGTYTEEDFARAVRDGVKKDGTHLYPAMPYTAYAKLSDDDIKALYAYFMSEVKPVDSRPQETQLPFPFSVRSSMAAWNLLFADSKRFTPRADRPAEWNRGAYLAEALEHCSTCHTPRNALMSESGDKALAGGAVGAGMRRTSPPTKSAALADGRTRNCSSI